MSLCIMAQRRPLGPAGRRGSSSLPHPHPPATPGAWHGAGRALLLGNREETLLFKILSKRAERCVNWACHPFLINSSARVPQPSLSGLRVIESPRPSLPISLADLAVVSKSKTQKVPALAPGLPVATLGGCPGSPVTDLGHSSLAVNFWQRLSPSFKAGALGALGADPGCPDCSALSVWQLLVHAEVQ